ncbi:MAG: acetyl/propionyl/methylcrotonyl-CoA carboxylase subunit alpha [Gammaproteobacteria bacterium]|nr:acetyl/propionyl/methylcrotonyl-CoA carboxylase subunit alpha [Gammaproteobacteria bacterium]
MFNKILIANRGEIACRIITTARKMGVKTVAVYSDADKQARHVKMADEAVHLGPSPSRESYLVSEKVIAAAKQTGAEAIHPGYGFLSENAEFCRLCEQENITFIGPPVAAIEAMGSKSAAKNIMEKAKVPLVPGYHGDEQSLEVIKQAADEMGYPVLLKAAAGGGGKGMRQIWHSDEFAEGFDAVKREALSSFGDDHLLVEKYLTAPRHVEIQVFCDSHGNAVYLFERDCSVQRRHQKVIEEAPAFAMPEALRQHMGEAAIKSAQAIGYVGAGTVEFLLNPNHENLEQSEFYFMEMNTRLQVEHPVTEMITGEDLVEWQLKVAAGQLLPKKQAQLSMTGHAFEARIYAEDPNNDFLPATGKLNYLNAPAESRFVRVDTGVEQGDEVSVFYDPMIAKLIVWDENRQRALTRLKQALTQYQVQGVTTNIEFLYNLANSEAFANEQIDTGFIEKHHDSLFPANNTLNANQTKIAAIKSALAFVVHNMQQQVKQSPWSQNTGFRLNQKNTLDVELKLDSTNDDVDFNRILLEFVKNQDGEYIFDVTFDSDVSTCQCSAMLQQQQLITTINGHHCSSTAVFENDLQTVHLFGEQGAFTFNRKTPDFGEASDSNANAGLTAPMNGTMVNVLVEANEQVKEGQALVIMEAMKMEHTIRAPKDGTVTALFYQAGDMVSGGAELIGFEAIDA